MYAEHSKNLASFGSWERRGESDRQAFRDSGGGGGPDSLTRSLTINQRAEAQTR